VKIDPPLCYAMQIGGDHDYGQCKQNQAPGYIARKYKMKNRPYKMKGGCDVIYEAL
jgi:hypothetical protein